MIRRFCFFLVGISWFSVSGAQTIRTRTTESPPLLDRSREIALARSAAPDEVSGGATVLVLQRGGYVVAEAGTTDVTCFVDRSWAESIEPQCFDAEGSATILRIFIRRAVLREEGKSVAEIDAAIAEELRSGQLRPPARPAMSYMMSSAQILYNDNGQRVGAWRPHLMIYYPYITAEQLGARGAGPHLPMVSDGGTPTATIVIVVPEFVELKPPAGGS